MRAVIRAGAVPVCLLLAFMCLPATAGQNANRPPDGIERLQSYLQDVKTLRAAFSQQVIDRDQQVVESATGRVALARPGRFRWDYFEPFQRVIVADGERVWLFEADLDQVTVRRLDAGLGSTPAALLTGALDVLDEFQVSDTDGPDGLVWVQLEPRDTSADFESIRLGFDGENLTSLILK
ncbi:MAG TPA: outer membrane lipoprotein chaperone LolA, partial [Chromatiales bacterium]|nr:outer membrane lipoprotein chaperone LolA [Chromatiales bacterium]